MRISPEVLKGPSPEVDDSWRLFLDPAELRTNLITASIYIAGFETLKSTITGRIRDFFWTGWDHKTGDIVSESYNTKVLDLDPKRRVYEASLAWLKQMSVIDDADLAKLKVVTDLRNEMAHKMVSIASEGVPAHCEQRLGDMIRLLHKIEVWWIRNVEMEINPDFCDPAAKDEDMHPGSVITLQMMTQIALGTEDEAREPLAEYIKRYGPAASKSKWPGTDAPPEL
ncbi:MAG: hypothetical protein NDJ72_00105 [Elusimicrobia bacterium]|nr:hypothetical protein [Elusimicrobiota bacterium]